MVHVCGCAVRATVPKILLDDVFTVRVAISLRCHPLIALLRIVYLICTLRNLRA